MAYKQQYDFSSAKGLQQWLWDNDYFKKIGITDEAKAVDGNFKTNSIKALKLAQDHLKELGLYNGSSDGLWTRKDKTKSDTVKALEAWHKGWARIKHGNKTFLYNRHEKGHSDAALEWAKKQGLGSLTIEGQSYDLSAPGIQDLLYKANRASANGAGLVLSSVTNPDGFGTKPKTEGTGTQAKKSTMLTVGPSGRSGTLTTKSAWDDSWTNGGIPEEALDQLVLRYVFNRYHDIDTKGNNWGITYDYNPRSKAANAGSAVWDSLKQSLGGNPSRIDLKIDPNVHSAAAAERIARGAGHRTYYYGGKKMYTNLFADSEYKDQATFDALIKDLERQGRADEAQKLYNAEMRRQYESYGIDNTMLTDKSAYQWNNLLGVNPYGYSENSLAAIASGNQSYQEPGTSGVASGLGMDNMTYRYDPNDPGSKGRLEYYDYNGWFDARISGAGKQHNRGLGPVRATTSTYFWGLPVYNKSARTRQNGADTGLLYFADARPNSSTQIDRQTYYDITDRFGTGKSQMKAYLYDEVAKNPQAAFQYFRHLFGDRSTKETKDKKGRSQYLITTDKNYKYDVNTANRLAHAAGMRTYHNGMKSPRGSNIAWNAPDISVGPFKIANHDLYESLKSFYENGFDAEGNLRDTFNYGENGYNYDYDGGGYTVQIRNGKPVHAIDFWNMDLSGHDAYLNSGYGGQGTGSINRFRLGGRLLDYCKGGSSLKGNKERGSDAGTNECAEWSNTLLRDNGYDISGNAWALNNVDLVYSGYEGLSRPETYNKNAVHSYNLNASKNVLKNFDSKTLDPEKVYVVNMYYKDSPAQEKAYAAGGNTGTHTGVLTHENNRWTVTHNIHGKIYKDDFIGLQGRGGQYGVTAVYAPRTAGVLSKVKQAARTAKDWLGDVTGWYEEGGKVTLLDIARNKY